MSGAIPAFRAEPFPPDWVRLETHTLADPDCRHYSYEAYAGVDHWLVRYVMFPEPREGFRDIEAVFLVPREGPPGRIRRLPPEELQVEPEAVRWRGRLLPLVDRRDLLRD
ncbi:MAG TPA: hypothetical protein DHV93_11545 [Holophagaceae bacterium]|nr:hypothetical protein [Holophagaceae bacterium]